jgi:hypothetical protein
MLVLLVHQGELSPAGVLLLDVAENRFPRTQLATETRTVEHLSIA